MRIKTIFWDFDGVILESKFVRINGFKEALKDYPENAVKELLLYHDENGGKSRYDKFNYFFARILAKDHYDSDMSKALTLFNEYQLENLVNQDFIIKEIINFITEYQGVYSHVIISASDEQELRLICNKLNISHLFNGIFGSPIDKTSNIELRLKEFALDRSEVLYIGDTMNDYKAAVKNDIAFLGYNADKTLIGENIRIASNISEVLKVI